MFNLIQKFSFLLPLACLALLFIVFSLTNPADIGPTGLLVVFVLLYGMFTSSFFLMLYYSKVITYRLARLKTAKPSTSPKKAYYLASILGFGPVMLIALQSVGQLSVADAVLVLALLSLGVFYSLQQSR